MQTAVHTIKSEMFNLRQTHALKMAELNATISRTSHRIIGAVVTFGRMSKARGGTGGGGGGGGGGLEGGSFRRERMALSGIRSDYDECSEATFKDLK